MKRLLLVLCSFLLCGTVLAEPKAPVPPPWKMTKNLNIMPDFSEPGLAVEGSEFFSEMYSYTMFAYDWFNQANESFISLEDKVKDLEEEVADLKKRVAQLEAAQPGGKPAPDPRIEDLIARVEALEKARETVKAPFKVVNGAGKVLFSVVEDGTVTVGTEGQAAIVMKTLPSNSAFIQVSTTGSRRVILAANADDGAHVMMNDGPDAEVQLTTSQGNNGFIRLKGGTSSAILNADASNAATLNLEDGPDAGVLLSSKPENLGLLAQKAGKNAVSLGAITGKGVALRLYNDAAQQVVSAGANPDKGDTGIVSVGTGSKTAAWISSEADGSGLAQVFASDGTGAAALVGKERAVAAYNQAGSAVATISKSDKSEGGTVVARNPGGEGIFAAGFASEYGGGEACVWRAKRSNTFCLGLGMPGMGVGK